MCRRLAGLILAAVLVGGCLASGRMPLETLTYEVPSLKNKGLIIFLQGLGGTTKCFSAGHECFEAEGFVEAVRSRGLPYDMVAPGAHYGYYKDRTLIERLRSDVILPAMARGYNRIWLVGVSMGGLGSVLYLNSHPDDISGILTLGPFLGYDKIIDEISAAGGVQLWQPGSFDKEKDWQRAMWQGLKERVQPQSDVPIFLGYGTKDLYAKAHKLLASALPPQQVFAVNGGHNFTTFRNIWEGFLDGGHLDR